MKKAAKIISIINWKGGVGKTTLTHHFGTGLQELPHSDLEEIISENRPPKVLFVDTDAQCNLSISCLTDSLYEDMIFPSNKNPILTIRELFEEALMNAGSNIPVTDYILKNCVRSSDRKTYEHIDLIPAHPDLIYTDMNIAVYSKPNFKDNLIVSDIYKFQILQNILDKIKDQYDFIFIDCPPNLNYITQNALYTSDYYLIPTVPDKLSSYGIIAITNKVNALNETFDRACNRYTKTKLIGIIPNNVREYAERPKGTQANILFTLKKVFGKDMFENYLTYGDGILQASNLGYPVFALEHSNQNSEKQSKLMKNIIKEFLHKISEELTV